MKVRIAIPLIFLGACGGPRGLPPEPPKKPLTLDPVLGERAAPLEEAPVLAPLPPGSGTIALVGGTVFLGDGRRLEPGTVVLSGGKVSAVGPADQLKIPSGATTVDARGRFVTPGLIDTHSHLGVYASPHVEGTADGNEMTDPTTPYVFSEHAFWPQDPGLSRALAGGITSLQILPGSGNVIGGRAVSFKLRPRLEARAMRIPDAPFGLKMACGENPKRVYGTLKQQPMSRMGNITKLRQAFLKAKEYNFLQRAYESEYATWQQKYEAAKANPVGAEPPGKEPRRPDRNLGFETLADAMAGKIQVHIHCYRADEMLLMIALSKELGFKIASFHHAVEAYKIADVLAKEGIGASMWADWWGFKLEAWDGIEENIAAVSAAGGLAIVHSDSEIGIQRLNQEAAKALASGRRLGVPVNEDDAIRWVTLNPAKALGIDRRTGSLEVGKDADVVLWSANPLSIYAKADQVYIDGELAFDRQQGLRPVSDFEVGTDMEEVLP